MNTMATADNDRIAVRGGVVTAPPFHASTHLSVQRLFAGEFILQLVLNVVERCRLPLGAQVPAPRKHCESLGAEDGSLRSTHTRTPALQCGDSLLHVLPLTQRLEDTENRASGP